MLYKDLFQSFYLSLNWTNLFPLFYQVFLHLFKKYPFSTSTTFMFLPVFLIAKRLFICIFYIPSFFLLLPYGKVLQSDMSAHWFVLQTSVLYSPIQTSVLYSLFTSIHTSHFTLLFFLSFWYYLTLLIPSILYLRIFIMLIWLICSNSSSSYSYFCSIML